ncbi:MAG TPA: putative Ig domain-containing protein [Candidatus Acidoferrum sp.]
MKRIRDHSWILEILVLGAVAGGTGCNGGSAAPPPPPISVSIAPSSAQTVDQGQATNFTANVSNDSSNQGVNWTLTQNGTACSPACGTISPAKTSSGAPATYTAPASVNANVQFNVTATSVTDASKSASDTTTAVPAPSVTSPAQLPASSSGQAYSYTLSESGGVPPFTWSIVSGSLPPGLSLNTSTGVISGTPTASAQSLSVHAMTAGTPTPVVYSFTAKMVDSGSPQLTAQAALSISNTPSPLSITTSSLSNGAVGAAYSQTLTASGGTGTYTWSLQSGSVLPAGLALSPSGVISGIPTGTGGTSNFTVQVKDSASSPQTATAALSIQVISPLSISTTTLPGGVIGSPYGQSLAATGGTTPYTWSISSGSLPAGLSLTPSTGAINGTPAGPAGAANFTVKVIDASSPSQSATASLSIAIANASPVTVNLQPTNPSLNLAQGNSVDFFAVVTGDPANAGVVWALLQNSSSCSPSCGTLVPGSAFTGSSGVAFPATYTPPSGGLPIGGLSLQVTATSVNGNPQGTANAGLSVRSCNTFQDILCGQINFYVQGFDQNGKPAAAAGSFTATGIPVGTAPNTPVHGIACGVIDINDAAGIDSPTANPSPQNPACATTANPNITSGSYTFDPVTFTGTLTLNIASNLPSAASHSQRSYAFTAVTGGSYPLIEFEPVPAGGCTAAGAPPACGFQGSGFISPMGSTAASILPPSKLSNFEFGFAGNDSGNVRTGLVGAFLADSSCNFTAFPAGTPVTVTSNQNGNLQYGSVTTPPNKPCSAPDSVTGRSTVTMNYSGQANLVGNMVIYPSGLRSVIFLSAQGIATAPLLVGLAQPYSVPTLTAMSNGLFSCGLLIVSGGLPNNCMAYGSGASGGSVTLTLLDEITQPSAPAAWALSGTTLTGTWRATEDQIAGGTLTSTAASTGGTYNFSYVFDTTSGVGDICLYAAPCTRNPAATPAAGPEFASSFGSAGFLLSLDNSVSLGAIQGQFFLCPQQNCAPSSLQTIVPGSYAAGTLPPALSKVPNSTGTFDFKGTAAMSPPCPSTTLPATLAGPLALSANAEASVSGQPLIALANLTGSYCTDNTTTESMVGWGNGVEFNVSGVTHPAPPQFDLILSSGGASDGAKGFLMETDNLAYPGGQMLMELLSQTANAFAISASPSLLLVPQNGQSQTSITVRAIGPINPVSPFSSAVALSLTSPLPSGLTGCFLGAAPCTSGTATANPTASIPNGNGSAILVLFAAKGATTFNGNSVNISATNGMFNNSVLLSVNLIP